MNINKDLKKNLTKYYGDKNGYSHYPYFVGYLTTLIECKCSHITLIEAVRIWKDVTRGLKNE